MQLIYKKGSLTNNYKIKIMLKSIVTLIFLGVFSLSLVAQTDQLDKRLLVKYKKNELKALQKDAPQEYKYINYCLDNAWYISPLPKEKMKSSNNRIGQIKIKDVNNLNFYKLNIEIIENDYQFFAIEGTDKMLVVKSKSHILKEIK
ncbi:MAG: hypothetical protein ACPGSO_01285 [Vicingaceae bacterium]